MSSSRCARTLSLLSLTLFLTGVALSSGCLPESSDDGDSSNNQTDGGGTGGGESNGGGNGGGGVNDACLQVDEAVVFGGVDAGQTAVRTIALSNCGDTNLRLDAVALTDDADGAYTVDLAGFPNLPDAPQIVPPDTTLSLVVRFSPTLAREYVGELTIVGNTAGDIVRRVPLQGQGREEATNSCPVAVAESRLAGDSLYGSSLLQAVVGDTVELTGVESADPDGTIASYGWAFVLRPEGSSASFAPDNTVTSPTFVPDVAGTYVVELEVTDDQGQADCGQSARVTIDAGPGDGGETGEADIAVELTWDTPLDSDQTDTSGTDMDLHYLHSDGEWQDGMYDIYWRNETADWGAPGAAGDPHLELDDSNGAGPELIRHDDPEDGVDYTVGVYYYTDEGYGPSYATVRIYVGGELRYEYKDQYLASRGYFWRAAAVSWPQARQPDQGILAINMVQCGIPGPNGVGQESCNP